MKSRTGPAASRGRAVASSAGSSPRWSFHPAAGSALLALLLYLPASRYGFVRDDHQLIADNSFMHASGYLWKLITSDYWSSAGADSGLWRPLVLASYWLDGRLGGWLPGWFHIVNLVSHVIATAVLALLMSEVGVSRLAVWFAAVWFAAMPAHVESVAWISGRTDVWCALFGLLALWLHERGARGPSLGWRVAAAVAFAAALASKEAAATLIVVLAVLAARRQAPSPGAGRRLAIELTPYLGLTALWTILHARLAPGALAATHGWPHPALAERIWTAIALLPSQLAFLVPGLPLGPDFRIDPARSAADPRVAVGLVLHALAWVAIVRGWRSRSGVSAATLLLWLPLALIGGLAIARGALFNGSRNLYLPSAGAAWLLGVGAAALWKRGLAPTTLPRWLVPAGFAALVIACAGQAYVQISSWRTDETMYAAMIHTQPKNADGFLGLALVDIGYRRDTRALNALRVAEALDSTRYETATYHAAIATRRRNWPEVLHWARLAQARGATEADSWLMEVTAYQAMGKLPEARLVLDTLMASNKSDPDVAAAFGEQMLLENRPARAVKPLQYAVGWNPGDASLALRLGDAYARTGYLDAARDQLKRAVGLDPSNVDAWLRLASVCHLLQDLGARDDALRSAASLPGVNRAMVDSLWRKMAGVGED